ncbi:gp16 family protein [Aeromonas veronii]|uniref:gp16 family protein n=1 Tax=Aeromonas veronii TaxID=654 RepID=UPI003F7A8DF2
MSNAVRNGQIAKIHIAKVQLGLDDEEYRALLGRVAGVSSAKDLDPRQIGAVLAAFEKLGWQPKALAKQGRKRPNMKTTRQRLIGKIEAQLTAAGRPWAYADAMALRICKVERLEWCDEGQLRNIVIALNYDANRHGRGYGS